MNKNTKWNVTSVENYDMGKVLEWLLNNGGGYNFWHGDFLPRVTLEAYALTAETNTVLKNAMLFITYGYLTETV